MVNFNRNRAAAPLAWLALIIATVIVSQWQKKDAPAPHAQPAPVAVERPAQRPAEAPAARPVERPAPADALAEAIPDAAEREQVRKTLDLIDGGGPFPYPKKDGTVFGNREGRLPAQARGYYREYTVPTPRAKNRGARRIVRGKGGETWYTNDHYGSFVRLR
jgi:ribonuclease T1